MPSTFLRKKRSLAAFFSRCSNGQPTSDSTSDSRIKSISPHEPIPGPRKTKLTKLNPNDRRHCESDTTQHDEPLYPPPTTASRFKRLEAALDGKTSKTPLPIYDFYTQPERGSTMEVVSRLRRRKTSGQLNVADGSTASSAQNGGKKMEVADELEVAEGDCIVLMGAGRRSPFPEGQT